MPACRAPFAETADASPEDYDRMRGINLRGAWSCMKYKLLQMRDQANAPRELLVTRQTCRYR
jgi:NAD(P)-dependent dehydrogenase (short-subunit alcohol dehydrogenase family)